MKQTLAEVDALDANLAELASVHTRTVGAMMAAGGCLSPDERNFERLMRQARKNLTQLRKLLQEKSDVSNRD